MIIILMGVSGCGKTTVGKQLSLVLGYPFYDSDDFHSPEARLKMTNGVALTDEDRQPWLEELNRKMKKWNIQSHRTVLACSALKQKYRDLLSRETEIVWVYLKGDKALIRERLQQRRDHFASIDLLDSQFDNLEEPQKAIILDISAKPERLIEALIPHFSAKKPLFSVLDKRIFPEKPLLSKAPCLYLTFLSTIRTMVKRQFYLLKGH